ncbi:GmrSD restriction endonuclease domain-containing protein [Actinomadura welshii]
MQAREVAFFQLIEGEKQFQVPLYQRTYSWGHREWARLWADVLEQAEIIAAGEERTPHFIGSVVLAPGTMSAGDVQRWLVVDGQQRLTTLMLASCALRDRFREIAPREADRVHKQYLVNEFREGLDQFRLLPTQADRKAFIACVDSDATAGGSDGIGAAYRFFRQALIDYDPDGDAAALKRLETVVRSRLSVVGITAEQGDNVYRIFESLNNTGVKLSQTDLLRNYVFMLLPTIGERVYDKIWLPMQEELGAGNLELLAWLDLVIRGDYRAKQSEVYRAQQRRLGEVVERGGETALEGEVAELYRRGRLLMRVIEPAREEDERLRAALQRLQEWGGQITFPVALHMLDLLDHERATAAQVARALGYVESFLVRRMIAGIPTNNLNRILNSAPKELETDRPVDEAVHRYLSGERRYWPSDEQLRAAVRTRPFYWSGRPNQRFFVLKRLEQSHEPSEPVDFAAAKLTIEHVMPQTATQEWLDLLAAEVTDEDGPAELHAELLHTLGNLTLTADNSALSNSPFHRKQEIFDASALRMNREIAEAPSWGRARILERGEALAERCASLWPAPLPGGSDLEDERRTWVLLRRLLAELPAGSWTTFGDLAAVIGATPAAVGTYLASRPGLEHAHRVLTSEGTVSASFRWPDDRAGTPRDVLEAEGVTFTGGGADPARRLTAKDLAGLLGMDVPEDADDDRGTPEDRFTARLAALGGDVRDAVDRALRHWRDRGGELDFGTVEPNCIPFLRHPGAHDWIWPVVLYPRIAKIEVVFQHLAKRPPFDDAALREEFRRRLNRIEGSDIPGDGLTRRPGIPMTALPGGGLGPFLEALDWFMDQVGTAAPRAETPGGGMDAADPGTEAVGAAAADARLAAEFHSAMLLLYSRTKSEVEYNASGFIGMVTEHGGVGAARLLLASPTVSDGFAALHERGRLDLTVEAHVLDPRFAPLFTEDERDRARHRLTEAGYRP